MSKVNYVLAVVLDLNNGFVIGLTKKKGPQALLNKLTFPGGKIEAGEDVAVAATREVLEETGVHVPEQAWVQLGVVDTPDYSLTQMVALSDKVLYATTKEDEPVWHLAIARHLEYAKQQPAQYVPDFLPILIGAVELMAGRETIAEPMATC